MLNKDFASFRVTERYKNSIIHQQLSCQVILFIFAVGLVIVSLCARLKLERDKVNKMIIYRVYTERKYNIERIASKCFDGFTLFNTIGYWKGKKENAVCIEIIGTAKDYRQVKFLASKIKSINNQESVYVIRQSIDAELL